MLRKKAFSNPAFILFLFVFCIITVLTVEYYRIYTVKEYIDDEMSRAVNIAVDTAMLDEYRQVHVSFINIDTAKKTFNDYLYNEMQLNSANERFDNGKFQYRLIIEDTVIEESPAKYTVKGTLQMRPILLEKLVPIDIDIPFKQTSRNQRYE